MLALGNRKMFVDLQVVTLNMGHRHAYPFIIWAYDVTLRVRTCPWDKFWIFFVNLKIFAFALFALGLSYLAEMLIAPFGESLFLDSIAFVLKIFKFIHVLKILQFSRKMMEPKMISILLLSLKLFRVPSFQWQAVKFKN